MSAEEEEVCECGHEWQLHLASFGDDKGRWCVIDDCPCWNYKKVSP